MFEFILIFALMLPENGAYRVLAQSFKTTEACEIAKGEIGKLLTPTRGVSYILLCERVIPSDGIKI